MINNYFCLWWETSNWSLNKVNQRCTTLNSELPAMCSSFRICINTYTVISKETWEGLTQIWKLKTPLLSHMETVWFTFKHFVLSCVQNQLPMKNKEDWLWDVFRQTDSSCCALGHQTCWWLPRYQVVISSSAKLRGWCWSSVSGSVSHLDMDISSNKHTHWHSHAHESVDIK